MTNILLLVVVILQQAGVYMFGWLLSVNNWQFALGSCLYVTIISSLGLLVYRALFGLKAFYQITLLASPFGLRC